MATRRLIVAQWILVALVLRYFHWYSRLMAEFVESSSTSHGFEPPLVLVIANNASSALQSLVLPEAPPKHSIGTVMTADRQCTKLQPKLDRYHKISGHPYDRNLWELSQCVPGWMKEYFEWHQEERKRLEASNWESIETRVMVMQCLRSSESSSSSQQTTATCGDMEDRFVPLLVLLREAHLSRRLLLIHWSSPVALEEFLVPPMHSIDWRAPAWLSTILADEVAYPGLKIVDVEQLRHVRNDRATTLVRVQLHYTSSLFEYYDDERLPDEPRFQDIYHDVWRLLFTPTPPIRAYVEDLMNKWRLTPGEYVAVSNEGQSVPAAESPWRLLNCASVLRPGGPMLYFSSYTSVDSNTVPSKHMLDMPGNTAIAYGKAMGVRVMTWWPVGQSVALDGANSGNAETEQFYGSFINLLLQGLSKCVVFVDEKYGRLASLIGYNASCVYSLPAVSDRSPETTCQWTKPSGPPQDPGDFKLPLFPLAVADDAPPEMKERRLTNFSSQPLPVWMTEYFRWHREKMANLTLSNWDQTKYIMMVCDEGMNRCGGFADRLKPLPFILLLAARHGRVLFIDWERPRPLQDFLEVPDGGLNWTVPTWLRKKLRSLPSHACHSGVKCYRALYTKANSILIRTRIQSSDGGEEVYAQQPDAFSSYSDVVHGLFRAMFKPVHRLQASIDQKMAEFGLVPGEYAATHLRNLYGERDGRDPNETIARTVNGINCASTVLPGARIYFASDDSFAVEVAREYGRRRSFPIGSWEHDTDPIHLDKDGHWRNRTASDYDATFVDFYLLGQARCVAYSNGGYGSFGALLSYNSSCSIRYIQAKKTTRRCTWVETEP